MPEGAPWAGRLLPPEPIAPDHRLNRFDSGVETINVFLKGSALSSHQERYSLVLVLADEERQVFGYYALAIGHVTRKVGTKGKARRGAPAHTSAVILGRLGVDQTQQGKGVGKDLLTHAIGAALALSQGNEKGLAPPIRVMAIKALKEKIASFYERVGFHAFDPDHPLDLVRSMSDLMADYQAAMIQVQKTWGTAGGQADQRPR